MYLKGDQMRIGLVTRSGLRPFQKFPAQLLFEGRRQTEKIPPNSHDLAN